MAERRNDNIPKEIRDYINAAADAGAQKALILLGHEIARTGIKKVLYAVGAAVVGVLSAAATWIVTHGGGAPK